MAWTNDIYYKIILVYSLSFLLESSLFIIIFIFYSSFICFHLIFTSQLNGRADNKFMFFSNKNNDLNKSIKNNEQGYFSVAR